MWSLGRAAGSNLGGEGSEVEIRALELDGREVTEVMRDQVKSIGNRQQREFPFEAADKSDGSSYNG